MNQPPEGSRAPSKSTIIAVILILTLAVVTIVGALTVFKVPTPATTQADKTQKLWYATLTISLIVFFLVTSGIIWAIFRYRRVDDRIPEQIHGSNVLELTWTIIPIIILVGLFVPSFLLMRELKTQPSSDEVALTVNVIGHQWWWEFDYPDQNIKVQATPPDYNNLEPPHLVVPAGKTILLTIRSTDVVHSFYAINTLYKIQAIPGNVNEMHMNVKEPGLYPGQCYQFCGLHHSDMRFVLDARSQEDFDAWVQEQQQQQQQGSSTSSSSVSLVADKGSGE